MLRKRPYIKMKWLKKVLDEPVYKKAQDDGRVRYWVYIEELEKYLRVVTLEDGETVQNAFLDRNFKERPYEI